MLRNATFVLLSLLTVMSEYSLHFPLNGPTDDNQHRLMELPKELVHLIEQGTQDQLSAQYPTCRAELTRF